MQTALKRNVLAFLKTVIAWISNWWIDWFSRFTKFLNIEWTAIMKRKRTWISKKCVIYREKFLLPGWNLKVTDPVYISRSQLCAFFPYSKHHPKCIARAFHWNSNCQIKIICPIKRIQSCSLQNVCVAIIYQNEKLVFEKD